jgi:hypothetical protein
MQMQMQSQANKIITAEKLPDWVQSGDPIVQRGEKKYMLSLTQTETRWEKLVRKLRRWIERH